MQSRPDSRIPRPWLSAFVIALVAMSVAGCRTVMLAEFDRHGIGYRFTVAGSPHNLAGSPTGDTGSYRASGDRVAPAVANMAGQRFLRFENVNGNHTISLQSRNFPASSDNQHNIAWAGQMLDDLGSEMRVEFRNGNGAVLCSVTLDNGNWEIGGRAVGPYQIGRAHSVVIVARRDLMQCQYTISGLTPPSPLVSTITSAWAGNNRRLDFTFVDGDSNSVYRLDTATIARAGDGT